MPELACLGLELCSRFPIDHESDGYWSPLPTIVCACILRSASSMKDCRARRFSTPRLGLECVKALRLIARKGVAVAGGLLGDRAHLGDHQRSLFLQISNVQTCFSLKKVDTERDTTGRRCRGVVPSDVYTGTGFARSSAVLSTRCLMNNIIYLVGLVVIVLAVLGWLGWR